MKNQDCEKFKENNEYILTKFSQNEEQVSHCMYVVWLMRGADGYFLCRDSKEFGDKDGGRYKRLKLDYQKYEVYEVFVKVEHRITAGQKRHAQDEVSRYRKKVKIS